MKWYSNPSNNTPTPTTKSSPKWNGCYERKRVLFIITEFAHGGSNKTLENYLPLINSERFEVSIFCHTSSRREGYYFELFKPYLVRRNWLGRLLRDTKGLRGLFARLCSKMPSLERLYNRYEAHDLQRRYGFDTVVGFQEHGTTEYAALLPARRKVAWLHSFAKSLSDEHQQAAYERVYAAFDKVGCVSDGLREYFRECFPELADKAVRIYNPLNVEQMQQEAQAFVPDDITTDASRFTLLSIGRLDPVKNFHLIPRWAKAIREQTTKPFTWYIMGAAFTESYRQFILASISECGVQDEVVLLGQKDNPYPYIQAASLVVVPSESESFSYVLNEAMALHTPVVANNFRVAHEMVAEGCGYVATLDGMPVLLARLIKDEDGCYTMIKAAILSFRYENEEIARQVNELL